eukprot:4874242-Prymnesium_polylepis.1
MKLREARRNARSPGDTHDPTKNGVGRSRDSAVSPCGSHALPDRIECGVSAPDAPLQRPTHTPRMPQEKARPTGEGLPC